MLRFPTFAFVSMMLLPLLLDLHRIPTRFTTPHLDTCSLVQQIHKPGLVITSISFLFQSSQLQTFILSILLCPFYLILGIILRTYMSIIS